MSFTIFAPLPDLRNLGKKDVEAYFEWFLSIIPERLEALLAAVTDSPEFEKWQASYTPESLEMLGTWFAAQVETRKRSPQEIAEIAAHSPYQIDIPADALTDRTFGLAHDVGIYFAEVLRHQYPTLRWQQICGSKKNVVFGYAALSGFGKLDFSPVHLAIVLAYGIADKTWDGKRLKELYDTWSTRIN